MSRGAPSRSLLAGLYLLAVLLGVGSAWLVLRSAAGLGESVGPWRYSASAGSAQAGMYTRARVALGGLLALARTETLYYIAQTDSAGRPLQSRCKYRLRGTPPPARWWSITAYAEDFYLFAAQDRRYSLHGSRAVLDEQGFFTLISTPDGPGASIPSSGLALSESWLHTPGDRGLIFTLRLYHPHLPLSEAPSALQPPVIELLEPCS